VNRASSWWGGVGETATGGNGGGGGVVFFFCSSIAFSRDSAGGESLDEAIQMMTSTAPIAIATHSMPGIIFASASSVSFSVNVAVRVSLPP